MILTVVDCLAIRRDVVGLLIRISFAVTIMEIDSMPLGCPLEQSHLEARNASHSPEQRDHPVGELILDLAFWQQAVERRPTELFELLSTLPGQERMMGR